MKYWLTIVFLLVCSAALAACGSSSPGEGQAESQGEAVDATDAASPTGSGDGASPVMDDQPVEDVPPATASALLPPPPRGDGMARLDGYDALHFGMSAAEVAAAWDGAESLDGAGVPADSACYYLFPGADASRAPVAFMIENDRFVRYDVRSDGLEAPGGGQIGMSGQDVRQRHAGKVESRPHKYVEGGEYLRVTDVSGQSGILVFEIDADGQVTGWRAGRAPQVDYVEGCS